MTVNVTDIDNVIVAIVDTLSSALSYGVFDGRPTKMPGRTATQFVVIGTDSMTGPENGPPTDAATMTQIWKGLGAKARYEKMRINCIAVGRGTTVANARLQAKNVVTDVGQNLPVRPTENSYNALVAEVVSTSSKPTTGGAFVQIHFVIEVESRLL